jgi:hypothetical protein
MMLWKVPHSKAESIHALVLTSWQLHDPIATEPDDDAIPGQILVRLGGSKLSEFATLLDNPTDLHASQGTAIEQLRVCEQV